MKTLTLDGDECSRDAHALQIDNNFYIDYLCFFFCYLRDCLQSSYPIPERRRWPSWLDVVVCSACVRGPRRLKGGSARPRKEFKRTVVVLPIRGSSSNCTVVVPAWCLGRYALKPEVEPRMISRESCKSWTRSADGELYLCRFPKMMVSMYLSCHNDSLAH